MTKKKSHLEVGNVKRVKPAGNQVLIERLTEEEIKGKTSLILPSDGKLSVQAFVIDLGPQAKAQDYGFKIGDRVLLQGSHVPVEVGLPGRQMSLIYPDMIKAVLEEE